MPKSVILESRHESIAANRSKIQINAGPVKRTFYGTISEIHWDT